MITQHGIGFCNLAESMSSSILTLLAAACPLVWMPFAGFLSVCMSNVRTTGIRMQSQYTVAGSIPTVWLYLQSQDQNHLGNASTQHPWCTFYIAEYGVLVVLQ